MLKTIFLAFWVPIKELLIFVTNLTRYRSSRAYLKVEFYLFRYYLFRNPYLLCRRYLVGINEPSQPYGETPLRVIEKILKSQSLTKEDLFVDLGCGRGKLLFWVAAHYPCKVKGVDINPSFVAVGNRIIDALHWYPKVSMVEASYFTANISKATVIYVYAIALDDDSLSQLAILLAQHPPETRIISVSDPLNEYCVTPLFETIETFDATFLWGRTTLFLQCPLCSQTITSSG